MPQTKLLRRLPLLSETSAAGDEQASGSGERAETNKRLREPSETLAAGDEQATGASCSGGRAEPIKRLREP